MISDVVVDEGDESMESPHVSNVRLAKSSSEVGK
jgi:hypothetical protein